MEDDKTLILMEHTIHHNEHHVSDFKELADELFTKGNHEEAKLVLSAASDVESAVDKLREAKASLELKTDRRK